MPAQVSTPKKKKFFMEGIFIVFITKYMFNATMTEKEKSANNVLEKENTAGKLKVINAERIPVRSSFNIAPSLYITSISGPIYNRFTTGNKY